MTWRLAIDIGGTFTDVVALNEKDGTVHLAKVPSTPQDPADGFLQGIEFMTAEKQISPPDVRAVFHGTTVATNAILERKYSELGLIITKGYREALECARQTVPGEFGDITWWIKPERVVPLERIREIDARMDVRGSVTRKINDEEIATIAINFQKQGITAIAVSLLHSYRNPEHEERVRRIIRDVYPECFISISSDILRKYREYERTNTTCLNTALMPLLSAYHDRIATICSVRTSEHRSILCVRVGVWHKPTRYLACRSPPRYPARRQESSLQHILMRLQDTKILLRSTWAVPPQTFAWSKRVRRGC